jgi:hypothetical protein
MEGLIDLPKHPHFISAVFCYRGRKGGEMTGRVQPWELHERRRRLAAIVVLFVVAAICLLAVVYELG